jgi:hypothetical protein
MRGGIQCSADGCSKVNAIKANNPAKNRSPNIKDANAKKITNCIARLLYHELLLHSRRHFCNRRCAIMDNLSTFHRVN